MSEITKKVSFSDVDSKLDLTMSALISYMQDCINNHTEEINKGIDYLKSHNRAWFTVSWNIEIKKLPKLNDEITVRTWAYGFTAVTGQRNVLILDRDKNVCVCADSNWGFLDTEKQCPTKIMPEDYEGYDMGERYPMEKVSRKIKLPDKFDYVEDIRVRKEDLDYNNHMSNGRYIINAYEYVPDGKLKRVRIDYKKQCMFKEKLEVYINNTDKDYYIKFIGKEDGEERAVILFEME